MSPSPSGSSPAGQIGLNQLSVVSETVLGISPVSGSVAKAFTLEQNYPNPFNPSTVIRGQWTVDSRVTLAVYDILGQEVALLANGRFPAGRYSFTFDGTNLPSGVYFCRLTAGSSTSVRKMMLVR